MYTFERDNSHIQVLLLEGVFAELCLNELGIMYRYGNIYREVFHAEFEWCSLIDGTSKNIAANAFAKLLKSAAPQLFETCPFPTVSCLPWNFPLINFSPAGLL